MPKSDHEKAFDEFRTKLTSGFYIVDPDDGDVIEDEQATDVALRATKPWRNDVWKALAELERRVCPLTELKMKKGK